MFQGSVDQLLRADTLTARYLRGDASIPLPDQRREGKGALLLHGITTNNLQNIDCRIPLGVLTCVTGVSGSGKSSLVVDTLYKHLAPESGPTRGSARQRGPEIIPRRRPCGAHCGH